MLKINSGELRGRKLKTRDSEDTRPMLSRVRKSLFDLIGRKIIGSEFLDLFAGVGSVGIEALSMRAGKVTFVEINREAADIIKENVLNFKLEARADIWRKEALNWLDAASEKNMKFDIIFVGPPYFKGLADKALEKIGGYKIIKENGLVFVQHHKKEEITIPDTLELVEPRKYGDMILTILKLAQNSKLKTQS